MQPVFADIWSAVVENRIRLDKAGFLLTTAGNSINKQSEPTFQVCSSFFRSVLHFSVVMSPCKQMHPAMGLMGTRSIPMMSEDTGMCAWATCIQEPGAAHRSMHTRDFCRNSNLRFSWMSLKEALDL